MKPLSLLSVSLLSLALLSGSEGGIREVRVGVVSMPASDEISVSHDHLDGNVWTAAPGKPLDRQFGGRVTLMESLGQQGPYGVPVVGIAISQVRRSSEGDNSRALTNANGLVHGPLDGPVTATTTAFDLYLAYCLPVTRYANLEVAGFGGWGTMSVTDRQLYSTGGGPFVVQKSTSRGSGMYSEIGVQIGANMVTSGGFVLGVDVGYMRGKGENTIDFSNARQEYDITFSGMFAEMYTGFRF